MTINLTFSNNFILYYHRYHMSLSKRGLTCMNFIMRIWYFKWWSNTSVKLQLCSHKCWKLKLWELLIISSCYQWVYNTRWCCWKMRCNDVHDWQISYIVLQKLKINHFNIHGFISNKQLYYNMFIIFVLINILCENKLIIIGFCYFIPLNQVLTHHTNHFSGH